MTNHLQQLKTWIALQLPTTPEKQTLYKEVVRRAHTHNNKIVSPWYKRTSRVWIPVAAMAFCMVLFVSYNTNQSIVLEDLPDQQHDYQVLSAHEQVDKINKEKASLQKIIKSLPSETVASNVADEVKTIEQYIKTSSDITSTDTVSTDITTTVAVSESSQKIPLEVIQEYYNKIKDLETKKDYAEALILIGETKKIIENEKIDTPSDTPIKPTVNTELEKDSNKKQ